MMRTVLLIVTVTIIYGQESDQDHSNNTMLLAGKIGNFSIELLFHTSKTLEDTQNIVMSPVTVWNALAALSTGASGIAKIVISQALRLTKKHDADSKSDFEYLSGLFKVNSMTSQVNSILVDKNASILQEFRDSAKAFGVDVLSVPFSEDVTFVTNAMNTAVTTATHGRIQKIVEPSYFKDAKMILASAVTFKGQWTVPFNSSLTSKMVFYDSYGRQTGEVNMMLKKHSYPFYDIDELRAKVIELSYGRENVYSLIIMLPRKGVTIEEMVQNLNKETLTTIFAKLQLSKEEYYDEEVICYIPRFKMESNLDLTSVMKRLGLYRLFDDKINFSYISRTNILNVSKVAHRVDIEVTEDGIAEYTTPSPVEFINLRSTSEFKANRPFVYMIVNKVTGGIDNTIVLSGYYRQPSLY